MKDIKYYNLRVYEEQGQHVVCVDDVYRECGLYVPLPVSKDMTAIELLDKLAQATKNIEHMKHKEPLTMEMKSRVDELVKDVDIDLDEEL